MKLIVGVARLSDCLDDKAKNGNHSCMKKDFLSCVDTIFFYHMLLLYIRLYIAAFYNFTLLFSTLKDFCPRRVSENFH